MANATQTETPKTRARQPVKALNKSPAEIAAQAQADKERKAASRKALRETKKAEAQAAKQEPIKDLPAAPEAATPKIEPSIAEQIAKRDGELELMRATLRVDAVAILGDKATPEAIEAYVAEQMVVPEEKTRYSGPMLALVSARKNYVQAANGILCNGDPLAMLCGKYTREQVVASLGRLLFDKGLTTSVNPYIALNPGQQSMNLRNKARHALKAGIIKAADLDAAFAQWKPLV